MTHWVPPKGFFDASYIASSFPRLSLAQARVGRIARGVSDRGREFSIDEALAHLGGLGVQVGPRRDGADAEDERGRVLAVGHAGAVGFDLVEPPARVGAVEFGNPGVHFPAHGEGSPARPDEREGGEHQ